MTLPWQSSLINFKNSALNLFLKPNCPLCDRPSGDVLCKYCERQLTESQLLDAARYWQGDLPLFAWGKYEGAVKRSIGKLKYDGNRAIGNIYGEWLAASWQKSLPQANITNLIAMPIPLHPDKLTSRGFNQAELIASSFCRATGAKLDLSLQRTRPTVAQFGLSKLARQENVADAFALDRASVKSSDLVLLIDDIYTTGATVRSAALALRALDLHVYGVAVVATGRDDR
ncbi:ComF family protein [Chamaesiphon sp. OTE_8_metabat_110]|uniref:ComF family protein n=1 Tax=Chamaesiphon sp. OTE_8_metabat_110 TaxID=2964696 RepID=UPI00286C125D|nr:ComF family protein [Chamaesiphon sp. OTE_8_metabat_110]